MDCEFRQVVQNQELSSTLVQKADSEEAAKKKVAALTSRLRKYNNQWSLSTLTMGEGGTLLSLDFRKNCFESRIMV